MRRGSGTTSPDDGTFADERKAAWQSDVGAFLPALRFSSCFAYSPVGTGPVCENGRSLCGRLKAAEGTWLPHLTAQVWLEEVAHGRFTAVFGRRVVLVPVPGSVPMQAANWVGYRLAWCLKELGLAAEVWPVLRRRYAVRKSAFATAGERPSVLEHYASFEIVDGFRERASADHCVLSEPRECGLRLTLVDDVITRGRTLLAAARRVHEAFPAAEIRAFAVLRTLGRYEVLHHILDPCAGEVRWVSGDARRSP